MQKGKSKLLVVDDEVDVCKFAKSYFEKRDIDVWTTGNGEEALEIIPKIKPDLVLLDNYLEGSITGVKVLERLREFDKETKIVIMTGCEFDEKQIEEIEKAGITAYLHKPLVLEEISEIVINIFNNNPLPQSKKSPKPSIDTKETSKGSIIHKITNLIGIIRNNCEVFVLNLEDGMYKDRTDNELIKMSVEVMRDVIKTVDRLMNDEELIILAKEIHGKDQTKPVSKIKRIMRTIRDNCEDYIWDFEDGTNEDKKDSELINIYSDELRETIKRVELATDIVEEIRKVKMK